MVFVGTVALLSLSPHAAHRLMLHCRFREEKRYGNIFVVHNAESCTFGVQSKRR